MVWQWVIGIGLGIIAAIITTNLAIEYTHSSTGRRKNTKYTWDPNEECPICLEQFNDGRNIRYLNCLHGIHESCLSQLTRHSKICPICREPMGIPQNFC